MAGPKSAETVARELRKILDSSGASVATMPYTKFYKMCNRKKLTRFAYDSISDESAELNLVIGYGIDAVIIADDENFAPDGLRG